MRRKSHTTRSWSIRLSDSSASCTQFWMTVPIPLPATFDLRCPAHNYRWLHDDCHLVPNSMRLLLLFHPEAPKVRAVCFWTPSFNKDVCHNLASVSLGGAQNALHHGFCQIPLSATLVLIVTKGAMVLVRAQFLRRAKQNTTTHHTLFMNQYTCTCTFSFEMIQELVIGGRQSSLTRNKFLSFLCNT